MCFCPRDSICILLIKKRNIHLLFWPWTTGDVWKQVYLILNAVSALGIEAYVVALLAWLLLIAILGYFVHVLDNVIDTVYVCYAIDRDKGEVCKQKVHEVYVHLPISRNDRPHAHRTQSIVWYWMLSFSLVWPLVAVVQHVNSWYFISVYFCIIEFDCWINLFLYPTQLFFFWCQLTVE